MGAVEQRHQGTTTDEQLMIAVRDGEVRLLGALFERHKRMFYGFFVRLTGDPELSHDLIQDMFIRILKYRTSYRAESKFRSWAFRIARNLVNDHYGRARREVPLEDAGERPAPTVLPLAQLEHAQEVSMLHEAFAKLPTERRELLTLSHFERVPYAEIADMYSCPVNTIKVRVHRAVNELRTVYLKRIEKRNEL